MAMMDTTLNASQPKYTPAVQVFNKDAWGMIFNRTSTKGFMFL